MGRSPPTGSSTTCIQSLHPFNPLSWPAPRFSSSSPLLSYISETSLNFMDPTPIQQPLRSHFCSFPLMCLFWTHHQNQDMGLWGCQGFLYNIIKNSHVSEHREKMKGKGGRRHQWGCIRKLKITYTQVQNSLQCHFGSWDVETCYYT